MPNDRICNERDCTRPVTGYKKKLYCSQCCKDREKYTRLKENGYNYYRKLNPVVIRKTR